MNAASEPERTGLTGDSNQLSGKRIATPLPSLDPDNGALRAGLLSAGLGLLWVAWSTWRRQKPGDIW